jgi:hypothetical protein
VNRRKASFLSFTALLALGIGSSAVWGTILIAPSVTGHVTSVSGVDAVTIDGHLYYVKQGSPAVAALQTLSPGELVDVYLDGPATSSASQVVSIGPHVNQPGQ